MFFFGHGLILIFLALDFFVLHPFLLMCFYRHVVLLFHSVFPHAFRNGPARFRILRKTGDMLHHTFISCCKYIPLVLSCLTHVTHEDFRHAVVHIAT